MSLRYALIPVVILLVMVSGCQSSRDEGDDTDRNGPDYLITVIDVKTRTESPGPVPVEAGEGRHFFCVKVTYVNNGPTGDFLSWPAHFTLVGGGKEVTGSYFMNDEGEGIQELQIEGGIELTTWVLFEVDMNSEWERIYLGAHGMIEEPVSAEIS